MPQQDPPSVTDATPRPRTTAAVLAGGIGARMGGRCPKQFLPLAGRPIIAHAIAAFCAAPEIDDVIVLTVEDYLPETEKIVSDAGRVDPGFAKVAAVLPGGETRAATSRAVLRALAGRPGGELLLLHDAVRPLVGRGVIRRCTEALHPGGAGAVGVAIPSSDTVVRVEPDASGTEAIREVPSRAGLRRMQTPQGFRLDVIRRAHELALADPDLVATDDCGVVLRYLPHEEVRVIEGEESNIKVTNPGDVEVAEVLLRHKGERS